MLVSAPGFRFRFRGYVLGVRIQVGVGVRVRAGVGVIVSARI